MRQPLYKFAHEYRQAYDALYGDEDLPAEVIEDTLSGLKQPFEEKVLNIVALIKNMRADVEAMKAAEASINQRRVRLEKHIVRLTSYLLNNLKVANITNAIQSPEHYVKLRKNPLSVLISTLAKIPEKYFRIITKKEPDKTLLKEALKQGENIDGVSLIPNFKLDIK